MNSLKAFMNKFRKSGFAKCPDSAKEIVLALNLDIINFLTNGKMMTKELKDDAIFLMK